MSIVHLGTGAHACAQSLLPWYVSGRLDGEELAQVDAHLMSCARCRADVEVERRLQAAYPLSGASGDVERGFAQARQRIDAATPRHRRAGTTPPWVRWTLAAQFATILLLVVALRPAGPYRGYRGLGAPGPATAANAVVIFRPDATEQQIRTALRQGAARLVDGPTATNAYLVQVPQVPAASHAAALARLRVQPAVALAESLDAAAPP